MVKAQSAAGLLLDSQNLTRRALLYKAGKTNIIATSIKSMYRWQALSQETSLY